MPAERHDKGFPVSRRGSGPKFHKRFKPNDEQSDRRGSDGPRFGVQLQDAVDRKLTSLGVDHQVFENGHPFARSERIELVVETGYPDVPIVAFQYTLRDNVRGKITDFLRAAIQRADQSVPRVYLELRVGEWVRTNELADQVVRLVRSIVRDIRSFAREPGNVIGLVAHFAKRRAQDPEPMSLFAAIGTKARTWLNGLLVAIEVAKKVAEETLRKAEAAAKKKLALERRASRAVTGHPTLFHLVGIIRDGFRGFHPHPTPAFATSQVSHPRRMPFRR
ncbi:MAG: hypothetical protein WCO25_03765 [Candidatus Uhrbacteria bacterium]